MPQLPNFIELPPFERFREDYLTDEDYRALQNLLIKSPSAGVLIKGAGGLRKLRFEDKRRNKGKRGGLRIIYYYYERKIQEFWLFTLYDKDEATDLTSKQKNLLKSKLADELDKRNKDF